MVNYSSILGIRGDVLGQVQLVILELCKLIKRNGTGSRGRISIMRNNAILLLISTYIHSRILTEPVRLPIDVRFQRV